VTNSTVLVNETALSVAMGASDVWIITWNLYCQWVNSPGAGSGIVLAVTAPGSATVKISGVGTSADTGTGSMSSWNTVAGSGNSIEILEDAATSTGYVQLTAVVEGDGTNAGNVVLQFAQTVSNGNSTRIAAYSNVSAVKQ
jgi:hypothetical protein